jgi:hypothetical protein
MSESVNKAFLIELHALLEKYGAGIGWGCSSCSDTHGISGEYIYAQGVSDLYVSFSGDSVYAADVKEELEEVK